MSFIDALRSDIINLTHLRDEKLEEGFKKRNAFNIAEGVGLSLLPLDLAKVAVGGAKKPSDYLWAGLDAVSLIPVFGIAKLGKLGEVAKIAEIGQLGQIGKYAILGLGGAYLLTKTGNNMEDIRKKAQQGFIHNYGADVVTLDVTDKVKQVYPDVESAKLTIYANDISKIIPVSVYNSTPPPRTVEEMVKGWENGIELERMKIGNKYYYIEFPCKLDIKRENKTNYAIILIILIIFAIIGYYIYKKKG